MAGGKRTMGRSGCQRRSATADSTTLEDQCHPRKIFIGGLAGDTCTHDLRAYFARFGGVADAVVLRWPDGRSRGFGYVTFWDVKSASAALEGVHSLGGQEVEVKRAVPGTNKLFVGGLPQNTMAAELREHFETFGVVSDAVVMMDPATGRSRGFGFVCFTPGQEGAAAVAMALEQYKIHCIRGKWIEVKSAAPPHKFATREQSGEPAPACSAVAVPPACQTPPSLLMPPVSREMTQSLEDSSNTPLPNLLARAVSTDPKKVLPPPGLDAAISAPPGLGDSFKATRKEAAAGYLGETGYLGEVAAADHRGPVLWPGAGIAAAHWMPWLGAPPPLFSSWSGSGMVPDRPAPPRGRFEGSAPGPMSVMLPQQRERVSPTSADLSVALRQSLEKLVRLRMCDSSAEAPSDGLAVPVQVAVA